MKSIPLLLVFSLLIGSAYAKIPTRFTGQLVNSKAKKIEIKYFDNYISFEEVVFPIRLRSDGTFTVVLELEKPIVGELWLSTEAHPIYLEPGDELNLKMNAEFNNATLSFTGRGSSHNNYLAAQKRQFRKTTAASINNEMTQQGPKDFMQYIEGLKQTKLNLLEKHRTTSNFSPSFDAFAHADIVYWAAYYLMKYRYENPSYQGDGMLAKMPKTYYGFLDDLQVSNDDALPSINYIYFADTYLDYQIEREKLEEPGKEQFYINKNAKTHFDGKSLSLLEASFYYLKLKSNDYDLYLDNLLHYISENEYRDHVNTISLAYQKAELLSAGKVAPDFLLRDINGQTHRLSDFKGKVVYLGFWATWCSPCIHEMYASKRLHEELSDKNVEFMYISFDNSDRSWKNYVQAQNLTGVQLYADEGYASKVAIDYGVQSLPNYILIGGDGKIIKYPARRPSQPGAKEDILDSIEENTANVPNLTGKGTY